MTYRRASDLPSRFVVTVPQDNNFLHACEHYMLSQILKKFVEKLNLLETADGAGHLRRINGSWRQTSLLQSLLHTCLS